MKRKAKIKIKPEAGLYAVQLTLDGHELMILRDALEHYVPYSQRPAAADVCGYLRAALQEARLRTVLQEARVQFPGKVP